MKWTNEKPKTEGFYWLKMKGYPKAVVEVYGVDVLLKDNFGPKLTHPEIIECISLSGEDSCQACGKEWKDHHQKCEGSSVEELWVILNSLVHRKLSDCHGEWSDSKIQEPE